jgi:cobalt-zinc-cadmium efflux system outer membrane protein
MQSLLAIALSGCATTSTSNLIERAQRETQNAAVKSAGRPVLPERQSPPFRSAKGTKSEPIDRIASSTQEGGAIQLVAAEEDPDTRRRPPRGDEHSTLSERLKIPETLPGADAPPLVLPPEDQDHPELRTQAIEDLFPTMLQLEAGIRTEGAPDMQRYSLADLEQIALNNNPKIAQAAADVEAAVGAAIQAGAYPNPMVGYEADTVGSGGTRNYQGMFFTQDIITAGKLELSRAIANVDLMNRQLALRRARAELLQRVRAMYFAVLVARENLKYSQGLVKFTDEVFRIQVEQTKGGQTAAYEPMQLRALAVQSRNAFRWAVNNYNASWKQLAAALGDPNLPSAILEGDGSRVGSPVDYESALAYMLSNHTEILTARNLEFQARLNVRLAEVTPIPDVRVYSAIQHDFTTPPVGRTTYNLQLGVPVPIFNQNRGGIQKARGVLVRAAEELNRARVDLSAQLAATFARYENNRIAMEYYHDHILPDLARVYRGVYERHQQAADQQGAQPVGFGDIIVAQQQLMTAIANYVTAMNEQWTAYADLAGLLQLEDLSRLPLAEPAASGEPAAVPPVEPGAELPPPAELPAVPDDGNSKP